MAGDERADRIRRPPLSRTGPVRTASALLGGSTRPAEEASARERVDDVLVRSVELGYRVVDAYVRQGQEAARRLSGGSGPTYDLVGEARDLAGRMVRAASELATAWGDMFDLTNRRPGSTSVEEEPGAPAPPPAATPTAPPETVRVRIRVESRQAVEAALDVHEVPRSDMFSVPRLRAESADGPTLSGVRLTRDDDRALCIAVTIGPDQPPGTYVGPLLEDATNVPVGWLTVKVGDGSTR